LHLARRRTSFKSLELRLLQSRSQTTRGAHARIERSELRLQALNPLRVLERGYALVYGADGKLLRSAGQVAKGQEIVARLARGRIYAAVTESRDE
jgi:exodeoxyribonuclease VII large subunit